MLEERGGAMSECQPRRVERVGLREIWLHEAAAFTPWLARAENLNVVAGALGMEL
jgi:hypothetical protein